MVQTRSAQCPSSSFALLDALLAGNGSRARVLLAGDTRRAQAHGPSGFTALHAAALTDAHRMVAPLVEAGRLDVDQQIGTLDGPASFALRQFLREHSKLPSSKLCAVFRGVTPLHIASWLGHLATVSALLQCGADTELACLEGRTALAIACYFLDCRPRRSLAIVETLLRAGADPLCADFHGIGSLVLSPHCPAQIQALLLDRVLCRYGGSASSCKPEPLSIEGPPASGEGAAGPAEASAAAAAGAGGSGGAAAAAGDEVEHEGVGEHGPAVPPVLELPPDKHVDVLQAALGAMHWPAFKFFLDATSPEVEYPSHCVSRILSLAIVSGDVELVLRVLHSGLRPDPAGHNSQGHPHVAVAAVHGHDAVLDTLLRAGAAVTLKALHHATDSRSIKGLRLLLARGRPPVLSGEAPVHVGGAHSRSGELCVMLRLLRDTAFRLRYCYRIDQPRHAAEALAMVEALAAAGYRPTVYPQAIVHNGWIDLAGRLVAGYDPTLDKPTAFDLEGVNRYTWLAAKQEPWSPALHARWPPRFQFAVQHLLLCFHFGHEAAAGRCNAGAGAGAGDDGPVTRAAKRARMLEAAPQQRAGATAPPAPRPKGRAPGAARRRGLAAAEGKPAAGRRAALSALPRELLLHIIQAAAYPISAWV